MIQLTHAGRRTRWDTGDWLPPVSPSPLREHQHRSFPKELEIEDIRRIQLAYGEAARRAKEGGLDGLEVICSSHLPDQFWSPTMNHRTDGYGGSLDNRIRFSLEMFEAIRRAVGESYIVGIRMSAHEMVEGGMSPEESLEIAVRHARSGLIDFINVIGADASTDLGISKLIPTMGQRTGPYLDHAPGDPRRDRPAGVPRHPDHRSQHRAARRGRRLCRHGRHDPARIWPTRTSWPSCCAARRTGSAPASAPATASTGSMSAATRSACTTRRPAASGPCRT